MTRLKRLLVGRYIALKLALEVDADIYHLHDPDLLLIVKNLKRKNKKVIFDSHEDYYEQIKWKGWIPKSIRIFIATWYRKYENHVTKYFDGIVVVTPSQIENFLKLIKNVELITNYPILDSIDSNLENVSSEKKKQVCFAGGVTNQWNHHTILESFNDLPEIKYKLAGHTSSNYLNKLRSSDNWRLVDYLGYINSECVEKLYRESMCGLALLDYDTQVGKVGTLGNTKLFEYMKYGLPFICSDLELWVEIIDKHKCGIYVNPRDSKEISRAISFLTNNPQKAIKMGEKGKKAFIEEYNWDTQLPNLLNLYNKVTTNKQQKES